MGTLIMFLLLFIVLAVAARYLGFDSTERISSCEWQYRARWYGADKDQIGCRS